MGDITFSIAPNAATRGGLAGADMRKRGSFGMSNKINPSKGGINKYPPSCPRPAEAPKGQGKSNIVKIPKEKQ